MSTNTRSEQNSSDTTDGITVDADALAARLGIDLPGDTQRLGVDGAGEVHYHSPRAQRVWVVDGDTPDPTVTHVADVTGKSTQDWIAHVRGERGDWTVCYYDPDLATGLAQALQRAQETDR